MLPKPFTQANLILKGPENSNIIDLPVYHNKEEHTMTSLWFPNDQEREMLVKGGGIVVAVYTDSHPPLSVGVAEVEWREPAPEMKPAGDTDGGTPS